MNKTNSKRRNKRKTNKKGKRMYGKGIVGSKIVDFLNEPYDSFSDTSSDTNSIINNTETFDIETGQPNNEDYLTVFNEDPSLRTHSMDSLSSLDSDPELKKIFEEVNSPTNYIYFDKGKTYKRIRPATTVIQRPFSPLSNPKERRRSSSLPDYNNPYISGNRSLDDVEKGIKRDMDYLTFRERQKSPSFSVYSKNIGQDTGPIEFGGKKKKNKTKKYKKCTRKSRKTRK